MRPARHLGRWLDAVGKPQPPSELAHELRATLRPVALHLAQLYGFQVVAAAGVPSGGVVPSNAENQVEAVACVLQNLLSRAHDADEYDAALSTAIAEYHAHLLGNFHRWLAFTGLLHAWPPLPSGPEGGVARTSRRTHEVLLFHLIWGEAANLRLVPEYLCLLLFACGTALQPPPTEESATLGRRASDVRLARVHGVPPPLDELPPRSFTVPAGAGEPRPARASTASTSIASTSSADNVPPDAPPSPPPFSVPEKETLLHVDDGGGGGGGGGDAWRAPAGKRGPRAYLASRRSLAVSERSATPRKTDRSSDAVSIQMGQQMGQMRPHLSVAGVKLPLCSAWAASELPGLLRSRTEGDFLQSVITPMYDLRPCS